jgi:sugar phosphate isomerase/epimerase
MDRRSFLGTITAATIMSSRMSWAAADDRKLDKIGVQLYSVRELLKKDFEGTLAKVAAIGYREIEFAGYPNLSPQQVRAVLDRNGLAGVSGHVEFKAISGELSKTLDTAHAIGQTYIVCPFIDESMRTPDGWKRVTDTFHRTGEECKKAGIQFAYHNHDYEFKPENGQMPYDIILNNTDPKLVKMEMDLFWTVKGKQDPLTYFNRFPGRFCLVHVKDMKQNGEMTEVGGGSIDFKKIFAQSEKAGIQHYFVEHDQPKDPLESIKASYEYLRNLRY